MNFTFRPIDVWPGPLRTDAQRKSVPFKATYTKTLRLLEDEIRNLQEQRWSQIEPVIQLAMRDRDIRRDGLPRSDAKKPDHPGVIVSFPSRHGPLRYFTDVYDSGWARDMPGWQANLRAIALGLEALRKVDRYGIASRGEQYTGWKELPSGIATPAGESDDALTFDDAVELLVEWSRDRSDRDRFDFDDVASGVWLTEAFRAATLRAHPDHGGDPEMFRKLVHARNIIREANA